MPKNFARHLVSPEYSATLQQMHQEDESWGSTAYRWAEHVFPFMHEIGAKNILDYGCGKGKLKAKMAIEYGFHAVSEYDVGIEGKNEEPPVCDMVACIDVMEHIEPDFVDNVLTHISSKCLVGAFFVISTRSAKKQLPDGRNAHILIRDAVWWTDKLKPYFSSVNVGFSDSDELIVRVIK